MELVFAQFKASGSTGSNIVNWDNVDGWWCSCEDFHYRKHECKHIREAKKPSKDSSKDILERVLSEIKLLEEEYAGLCPINVLKANFCVDDMPEEKMDDILRSFREKGIIQEAQEGYLKYCY